MPVEVNHSNQSSSRSPTSTVASLKAALSPNSSSASLNKLSAMMIDQSMLSATSSNGNDVDMDMSDGFLFYDDDEDLSSSSDEDEDGSGEDDDSETSLDHDEDEERAYDAAENLLVSLSQLRAAAPAGLPKVRSANSLKSFLSGTSGNSDGNSGDPERRRRRRRNHDNSNGMPSSIGGGRSKLHTSNSMANLAQMKQAFDQKQQAEPKMPLSASVGCHIGTMISPQAVTSDIDENVPKPDDYLATLIGGPGERFAYDSLEGFFLPVKPEYVQAWTNDLTRAIRENNLDALKQMNQEGYRLQACNSFGETVVHLTVRRGTPEMLRFLLQDAGVSMRVCCDYGRTPLHDAAWSLASTTGAFEKMELLLQESPMQLYITDKRGFTPLQYVPRNRWKECNDFLDRQYAKGRLFAMNSSGSGSSGN